MLYIFDKDGTICRNKNGAQFINAIDEQELIPGVLDVCVNLTRHRFNSLAVASNQGGVAFGIMPFHKAQTIVAHAANMIGAATWRMCPHHPDGDNSYGVECDCRKPKPGMILDIMDELQFSADQTIFVGDRPDDKLAAQAAGVKFVWANNFFGVSDA